MTLAESSEKPKSLSSKRMAFILKIFSTRMQIMLLKHLALPKKDLRTVIQELSNDDYIKLKAELPKIIFGMIEGMKEKNFLTEEEGDDSKLKDLSEEHLGEWLENIRLGKEAEIDQS